MAKNKKVFNAGTLQSIIDNVSLTFDYEFEGTPSTQWVDVNPVPFYYHGDEDTSYETSRSAASASPPVGMKVENQKSVAQQLIDKATLKPYQPPQSLTQIVTNMGAGGISGGNSEESEGGAHAAEIEALKKYEHCWGTTGSPICSRFKV